MADDYLDWHYKGQFFDQWAKTQEANPSDTKQVRGNNPCLTAQKPVTPYVDPTCRELREVTTDRLRVVVSPFTDRYVQWGEEDIPGLQGWYRRLRAAVEDLGELLGVSDE